MSQPLQRGAGEPSRNAACPCGSGERYKRCCGQAALPPDAAVQCQRGVQLLRSGQAAAAIPLLVAAIQLDAQLFEAHHALGVALTQAGRLPEASAILAQAVALQPQSALALWDLGAAYDRQDLHEPAIDAYRRAVALAPELGDVQLRLGQLYAMYSRAPEASQCFDHAAAAQPNPARAALYRSDAALLRDDVADAQHWAQAAVGLEPGNGLTHGTLAGVFYNQGRFDEAAAAFETALRLDPRAAKYWDGLAHCRAYSAADAGILDRMQAVLRRGDLGDGDRMTVHFALGKVFDDCGDYAQAMAQFDAANAIRGRGLVFDRAGLVATVDRAIDIFSAGFFARSHPGSVADRKPLFIVGMYRSGTTLVEQILSSHRAIAAGGELTVWGPADIDIDAAGQAFDPKRAPAAIAKYLAVLNRIAPGAARVTDKLPPNVFRLGAIHALLPRAGIIHCERDPIDTCLSIYCTLFSARLPFAARKDDLVFYYQQYRRMMAHWRRVLPADAMLHVRYEQLVRDRPAATRDMVAFTGLAWDENCLQPERNERAIGTASAWQARQAVYDTSVQRWRRYAPWIGALRALE